MNLPFAFPGLVRQFAMYFMCNFSTKFFEFFVVRKFLISSLSILRHRAGDLSSNNGPSLGPDSFMTDFLAEEVIAGPDSEASRLSVLRFASGRKEQ